MSDLTKKLDELRRKLQRIDARYEAGPPPSEPTPLAEGREVETAAGKHWEIDRIWPADHRHGSSDVGALSEMGADFLEVLEAGTAGTPVERWVFLDTETTGLAGGSGTMAFLTGIGWITARGFEFRQYFIRDFPEEASALTALAAELGRFDLMVTYNGKAFDAPLLETRYRLARLPVPFARMRHVDLLFSARRLWRLALERCRLQDLERRILGYERVGDVDGALIPDLYFEYLRNRDPGPLAPVLSHNATDVLSLACVTAIVPSAFRDPSELRRPAEMVGVARWLRREGRLEEAAPLMRQALKRALAEPLVYETIWHLSDIERKLGRHEEALALWSELSTAANPWRGQALERLAVHYEHHAKDLGRALELTRAARAEGDSEGLRKREERLVGKIAGKAGQGGLLG